MWVSSTQSKDRNRWAEESIGTLQTNMDVWGSWEVFHFAFYSAYSLDQSLELKQPFKRNILKFKVTDYLPIPNMNASIQELRGLHSGLLARIGAQDLLIKKNQYRAERVFRQNGMTFPNGIHPVLKFCNDLIEIAFSQRIIDISHRF